LIVSDKESEKNFLRSAKNIKNIKVINDEGTNIYDMLKFTNVIITSSSMKKIETRLLDEKN
jgi:large subunit ribosomal protein L4